MKKLKFTRKGQTLVMTMMLVLFLSAIIAFIGLTTIKSRNIIKTEKKKDDFYYAAKAGQQIALQLLPIRAAQKATERLDVWNKTDKKSYVFDLDNSSSNSANKIFSEFNDLDSISKVSANSVYTNLTGFTGIKGFTGTVSPDNVPENNKIRYRFLFCNDINNNGYCDSGSEQGIQLIGAPNTRLVDINDPNQFIPGQSYSFKYNITSYSYLGGSSDADFQNALNKHQIAKLVTSGKYDINLTPPTLARYAILLNTTKDSSNHAEFYGEGDHIRGPLHLNSTDGTRLNLYGGFNNKPNSNAIFDGDVTISNHSIYWYGPNGQGAVDVRSNNPHEKGVNPQWNGPNKLRYDQPLQEIPQTSVANASVALGGPNSLRDDSGNVITSLTNKQRNEMLNNGGYTSISANSNSTPPKGVYMVHTTPSMGNSTLTGGIYIQGDVDKMIMSISKDPSDDTHEYQNYSITQGNKTTNIKVDRLNNQTVVETLVNGVSQEETTYNGLTRGQIHVEGEIKEVGGPLRDPSHPNDPNYAPAAIQKETKLNLSATGDIHIERDIKYEVDPRGTDGHFGGGDDLGSDKAPNVLGIFSSNGKVRIGLKYDSFKHDPTIHATIMAGKQGSVANAGELLIEGAQDKTLRPPTYGSLHLLGGSLTHIFGNNGRFDSNGLVSGLPLDIEYDQRTGSGNPPPYFPTSNDLAFDSSKVPELIGSDETYKDTINNIRNRDLKL